jgi:hypothetical protein
MSCQFCGSAPCHPLCVTQANVWSAEDQLFSDMMQDSESSSKELEAINELGRKYARAVQDRLFDEILNGASASNAAYSNVPRGPSPMASALPLMDVIKRMEEQSKGSVPFRPAYLIMPPESFAQFQIPMTTFADDSALMGFRVFQDYGFKVHPRSPILYSDIGASDVRAHSVVWKDVTQPVKPSAMIWCVVVAFLCWLLCAAAGSL